MHPGRRSILVRWIAYIVVVAATASWLYTNQQVVTPQASNVLERLTPKQVALPAEDVTTTIREAIDAVTQKTPNYGVVEKADAKLIVLDPAVLEDKAQYASLYVSALFLGPPNKYAILNGAVYEEGATLPDGRVVKTIDGDGVTVSLEGGTERVNWIPPYRVELHKPAAVAGARRTDGAETQAGATTTPDTEQTPAVDLNNLPPDLSPDQALQILQQVGQQQ